MQERTAELSAANAALREQIAERQRVEVSEREQRILAEALRDSAAAVNSTLDLDEVLDRILHSVTRTMPYDLANILLVDDGITRVARHLGYKERGLEDIIEVRWPVAGTPVFRRMSESGQPLVIEDTCNYPEWIRHPATDWIRSYVGAPILIEGQVIGFLNLDSNTPYAFAASDGEKLQAFADQAAIAIHNARLYDSLCHHAKELQAKTESLFTLHQISETLYRSLDFSTVVERALDVIMAYTHAPSATLYIVDSPSGLRTRLAARGVSEKSLLNGAKLNQETTLSRLAITRKELILSSDLSADERLGSSVRRLLLDEGFKSAVAVPLIFQEQVVGVVGLMFREVYTATAQEKETLLSIGSTVALALANARHVAQLEAEIKERERAEAAEREQRLLAEALRDTASAVNSTLNLDEVLDRILQYLVRVLPNDLTNILLVEAGVARSVRCLGYSEYGMDDAVASLQLPVAEMSAFRRMVETGQPLVIPDTAAHAGWTNLAETAWIRSFAGAPVLVEGQVIGFITLDSATPNTYSWIHGERLQAFANQAAIAIHNARLYDTIRRHAAELEQRVAERTAELETERAQLRAILDGMREGVMGAMHYEGRTPRRRFINQAMYHLLGYSAEEWNPALLKSETMSLEEYHRLWDAVERKVFNDGLWQGELKLRRKDGSEFDASLTITRVDGPHDEVIGGVLIVRDISQEKLLQEQKDRFVAHASHELRTPITNIKTRLYLMRKQPEKLAEHLTILEQVTDRMKRLVEDLLDLSRFRSGVIPLEKERVVVQDLIEQVLEVQQPEAERKGVTIESDLPASPVQVVVDTARMIQVITNLVTNAINYTPEGGRACIKVVTEANRSVAIEVRDNGIGIGSEHLPYIFQPFYRVGQKGAGVGLGLSISKEIVERHGGSLSTVSEPGRGSCFTVHLMLQPVGTSA